MIDISVFIAESLTAQDFYNENTDGFAAQAILKLQRVRSQQRIVLNKKMLKRAVEEAHEGNFSIFHLSCHGDEHGLGLTDGTTIDWSEFANLMSPFADETRMLVLASCFAGVPGVSRAFRKEGVVFGWIFGSRKGVGHTHSCLAWSVLYYSRLAEGSRKRAQMKLTLDKINAAVRGDFMYRRWDQVKYVRYASARKAEHRSGDRSQVSLEVGDMPKAEVHVAFDTVLRCQNVRECIEGDNSAHPCREIVQYQLSLTGARSYDEFHLPEPWCGQIDRAPILFVSSNPQIGDDQRALGRCSNEDAFDSHHFALGGGRGTYTVDGVYTLDPAGNRSKRLVVYWSRARDRAQELILDRQVIWGEDYAMTEIVRCKSTQEVGVVAALEECTVEAL